jgi:hypothetical protein
MAFSKERESGAKGVPEDEEAPEDEKAPAAEMAAMRPSAM